MKIKISILFLFLFLSVLMSPKVESAPIAPKSGAAMCNALAPADFQGVGISNAGKPTANVQDNGASAYCVYAGKSSATGGIELDIFYPAGGTPTEVKATLETAASESGAVYQPITITGADEARWSPKEVSGGPAFASLLVRRGNLVFVLGFPAGPNAQAQLVKLAGIVLQRL